MVRSGEGSGERVFFWKTLEHMRQVYPTVGRNLRDPSPLLISGTSFRHQGKIFKADLQWPAQWTPIVLQKYNCTNILPYSGGKQLVGGNIC